MLSYIIYNLPDIELGKRISSTGLILDIVGVILIIIYGIPTIYMDKRYKLSSEGYMFEDIKDSTKIFRKFRDKHNKKVRFNYIIEVMIMIFGFGLQILGNLYFS